jgi:hypothetical protein
MVHLGSEQQRHLGSQPAIGPQIAPEPRRITLALPHPPHPLLAATIPDELDLSLPHYTTTIPPARHRLTTTSSPPPKMEAHEQDPDQHQHVVAIQQAAAKTYQPGYQVCSLKSRQILATYMLAGERQVSVRYCRIDAVQCFAWAEKIIEYSRFRADKTTLRFTLSAPGPHGRRLDPNQRYHRAIRRSRCCPC